MKFLIIFITVFLYAFPMKKGDFATIRLNDKDWASKFRIIDVADNKLDVNSVKLYYDWLVGFYYYKDGENTNFVKEFYTHRKEWTLNPEGPFIHCPENGYDWCDDYYYNFGNKTVINKKIDFLLNVLKSKYYNGIFFDWANDAMMYEKEYKQISKNFKKLNPNKTYADTIEMFYKKLKEKGVFFITNQAFRAEKLLKYVPYDMTESYITTDTFVDTRIMIENKGWVEKVPVTNYYPIDDKSLKATLFYLNMLTKYKEKYKKYGFKNFIYMNYLAPQYKKVYTMQPVYKEVMPKNGIFFSYAVAKLTDNIVYAEVTDKPQLEKSDIYFYDLGKVVGKNYIKLKNLNIYIRYYENGFVLVSDKYPKDKQIKLNLSKKYYDVYNKKWIYDNIIHLHYEKDSITGKKLPLGRIFMYEGVKK